jgi:EAL domain-containing protein (putative c-di-GMP-specific phosphodiesterase class I)
VSELKEMGYRVALDDMGAGYAGLTSFAVLRPSFVKIDLSLVRNVDSDPVRQTLVRALANLSGELDIQVVAEGVETTRESRLLLELGCALQQGYLFARPAAPTPEVTW